MNKKENNHNKLWQMIAEGLKAKPAYLLIYAICALFILSGVINSVLSIIKSDYVMFFGVIFFMCFALFIAYLTVRKVESSKIVEYKREQKKLLSKIRTNHPTFSSDLERLSAEV